MTNSHRGLVVSCMVWAAALADADVPPRTDAGQSLVVPREQLALGDVYHVLPGDDAQIVVTSDAPLGRLVGVCRRAVGYFVVPFDLEEQTPPLVAGAIRIPIGSFDFGTPALNDAMRGPAVLDFAAHPEITAEFLGLREVNRISKAGEPAAYDLRLSARWTLKGRTFEADSPARLTLIPFTFKTMFARYPGDVLTLRCAFDIKPAELGLQRPDRTWNDRIADQLRVEVFLFATTTSPDKSLDPAFPTAQNHKHLRFLTLLRDLDQPSQAYALGRTLAAELRDSAAGLNRLASETLSEPGIRVRDSAFALAAAERANELTGYADPAFLETLARAHAACGDLAQAIRRQEQAVERAEKSLPPPALATFQAALKEYRTLRPPASAPAP